jgi:Domain of unknown function (DUF1877)
MSMNMFFKAFQQSDINDMATNPGLIDTQVSAKAYVLATDIETAWDVLRSILGGVGIEVGAFVDNVLSNGCSLISSEEVKAQAAELSQWTALQVLEGLRSIADPEVYHLEVFQDDEDYLIEQFENMQAFYNEAAQKGLGVLTYLA